MQSWHLRVAQLYSNLVVSYFCVVCEHVLRPNSQNLSIALHFTCYYKELSAEVKFSISWVLGEIIGLVKVYPSQGFHLISKFDADKLVTLATILVNRSLCNHQLGELIWLDYLGVLVNLLACFISLYDFYWLFCKVPNSIIDENFSRSCLTPSTRSSPIAPGYFSDLLSWKVKCSQLLNSAYLL